MTSQSGPGHDRPDPGLSVIISERRQLTNLAYRLLGSLAEAEDAVQETYARWYALSHQQQDAIASPGAWLTTVTSRICLNLLGSARVRRETYVGAWIPEPLPDPAEWSSDRPGAAADPADRVTLDESVNMAFLVVLESMTVAVVVDGVVQPLAAVAGAPQLVDVGAAGRGVAVKRDRARVRGLHQEVHKIRHPLAPGADLLLAEELDRDVGRIRSAPSGVNSDARRS
jgi:hypothetical protein